MNLTWHIIRKDLYAIRWMLLGWVLLTLVPVAFGIWARGGSDDVVLFAAEIQLINGIVMGLQFIMAIFITAIVVHEDQLLGNTAQWLTLPLSSGRLFAAKLGGLLVVLWVMPLLVFLPWWLANDFGPVDILRVVLQYSAPMALVVLSSLLVAAMTDGWTRFITWLLIFLVIVFLAVVAATAGVGIRLAINATTGERMLESVSYSRAVVVFLILLVSTMAVVANQFLKRRLVVSGIIFGAGFVLAVLAAGTWWWNVVPDLRRWWTISGAAEPAPQAEIATNWSVESARVIRSRTAQLYRDGLHITNRVRFDSLGPGEEGYGRTRNSMLIWPDGTTQLLNEGRDVRVRSAPPPWMHPHPAEVVTDPLDSPNNYQVGTGGWLPPEVVERILRESPVVRINFEVGVHKNELLAEVPLKAGERFGRDAWQFTVVTSERKGPLEQQVMVMERRPAAWFQPYLVRPRLATRHGPVFVHQKWGNISFSGALVSVVGYFNRSERPILESVGRWGKTVGESRLMGSFAGVELTRHRHVVVAPRKDTSIVEIDPLTSRPRRSSIVPGPEDEHWLDEAMLVWIVSKGVASMVSYVDLQLPEVEDALPPPQAQ